jgi:DNA-binding transcriptional regulator YdaS (Cro superfamily)
MIAEMEFRDYFYALTKLERERFARACQTSVGHLQNIAGGKRCGETLAVNIERESRRQVMADSLRPDVDWDFIRASGCSCKAA